MSSVIAVATLFLVMRLVREIRHEREDTRFTIAVDALWRLNDEWNAPDMAAARSSAATSLLAGRASDDIEAVLRFFDRLAFLARRGHFDDELVWHEFYWPLASYWYASADYRTHLRAADAPRWKNLETLVAETVQVEAQQRDKSVADVQPTTAQLREFLLGEVDAGECSDSGDTDVGPL